MKEKDKEWEQKLMSLIAAAFRRYHEGVSSWATYNALLDGLLAVTSSLYGYIGRAVPQDDKLVLLVKAVTTIGWSPQMAHLVVPEGLTFALEDTSTGPRLYGMSWRTGEPFICNDPRTSPHSRGGVPKGHPPIDHYLEVPISWGGRVMAVLALANRPGGFEPIHSVRLQGFLAMLASLMQLYEAFPPQPTPSAPSCASSSPSTTVEESSSSQQLRPQQQQQGSKYHYCAPEPVKAASFDAREVSHAVLDSVGEGVIVLDAKMRVRHANNGAARILGYTSGRSIVAACRHLSDLIPYYDEERATDWNRFHGDGKQQNMMGAHVATHARCRDGSLLSIDLSLSSFLFQRKIYFSAVLNDISHKKKTIERTKFLAFLSHEIRNPLQAIISGLQVLQSELKEEGGSDLGGVSAASMMTIMHRATSIMHRVIDDIVDYTRIETHQFSMNKEPFDVRSTLRIALEMAKKTEWHKDELAMELEIDPAVPRRAVCDRKRVEQVLMNLLTNAQKYTKLGRIAVRCNVTTQDGTAGFGASIEMEAVPVCSLRHIDKSPPLPSSSEATSSSSSSSSPELSADGVVGRRQRTDGESGEDDGEDCERRDEREGDADGEREEDVDDMYDNDGDDGFFDDQECSGGSGGDKRDARRAPNGDKAAAAPARYLCIEVEDTGVGISEADQKNLFSVYTHIDGPTHMCSEKTGLGLAITKRLCTVMGGNLWCRSQLGRGSVFTFCIPFDEAENAENADDGSQPSEQQQQNLPQEQLELLPQRPPQDRSYMSGLRVLVVDDNSLMRKTMNAILSKERCVVTLAENGQQAIDLVMKDRTAFDVMLIDCLMPVKDGYRTVAELRAEGIRTPMIAITGNSLSEQTQQCRHVGFDHCLLKPVQKAELFDTIYHFTAAASRATTGN